MTGTPILKVHSTTLPHLDFIEKIILDELVNQGKAQIINESPAEVRS